MRCIGRREVPCKVTVQRNKQGRRVNAPQFEKDGAVVGLLGQRRVRARRRPPLGIASVQLACHDRIIATNARRRKALGGDRLAIGKQSGVPGHLERASRSLIKGARSQPFASC